MPGDKGSATSAQSCAKNVIKNVIKNVTKNSKGNSNTSSRTDLECTASNDPETMPVRVECAPPPPANSKQLGVRSSLLYNGSKFKGSQKSKGNSYEVEVVLQVSDKAKVDSPPGNASYCLRRHRLL